jgi:hypothetical protein
MVEKPAEDATLNLKNKTLLEELEIYLEHIKVSNANKVLEEFKSLNVY